MLLRSFPLFAAFLVAQAIPLPASIIAELSGPFASNASVASPDPFGGYDYAVASWTDASAYTGVSILFTGEAAFAAATGTAYLTSSFGPGTTPADQIATAAFSAPLGGAAPVMLFSDLNLGAGTFYLTLAADAGDEIEWNVTDTATVTTGPGDTVNPGMGCFNGTSPAGYPPGTSGSCVADDLLFSVSASSVPEPPTLPMAIGGGMAVLLSVLRRRRITG